MKQAENTRTDEVSPWDKCHGRRAKLVKFKDGEDLRGDLTCLVAFNQPVNEDEVWFLEMVNGKEVTRSNVGAGHEIESVVWAE